MKKEYVIPELEFKDLNSTNIIAMSGISEDEDIFADISDIF